MEFRLHRRFVPARCDCCLMFGSEKPDDQLPHASGKSHNEYTNYCDNAHAEPAIGHEEHSCSLRRNYAYPILYTLSGICGVSVPDSLSVDRQGGDEEDRQGTEEGCRERERTVLLERRSPSLRKPHETKCRE